MKKLLLLLFLLHFTHLCAVRNLTEFVYRGFVFRSAIIADSLMGQIKCNVMYDTKRQAYSGIFINRNHGEVKWEVKQLSAKQAQHYYYLFEVYEPGE